MENETFRERLRYVVGSFRKESALLVGIGAALALLIVAILS